MTRESPLSRRAAVLLATAVVGAAVGAGTYAALDRDEGGTTATPVAASGQPAASSDRTLSVGEIYRRASRGVVEITVGSDGGSAFPSGDVPRRGQGSGFVLDRQGHVVTNHHVVDGATRINVTFADGKTHRARLVGSDASTDLAVIDVDAPESALAPLSLGDSDALSVGEGVVAIGSPFGLEGTVTTGIVSALHREMNAPNNFAIDDSIQTDAAINHGNSGGPLLNLSGEVVGVNAQIRSESGGNDGVGFAIPSNTVESVVSQLVTDGKVEHAYLGVSLGTISEDVAGKLDSAAGAAVTEVRPGTPAAEAGLRGATASRLVDGEPYPTGGDVITEIDGRSIASADELRRAIDRRAPGHTVELTVVRNGEERTVEVTLGERPS